jgi:hypothetical protein
VFIPPNRPRCSTHHRRHAWISQQPAHLAARTAHPGPDLGFHPGSPAPCADSPAPRAPPTRPPETSDTRSEDAHPQIAPTPSDSHHKHTHQNTVSITITHY